jgi:FkbM family methyltransferase
LIYDIGMHAGEDTELYLFQGFRVLAVEADPELVEKASQRFSSALRSGALRILQLGIAERSGKAEFWVCDEKRIWSSFHKEIASRSGQKHHALAVETVSFAELLQEYGIPYYLKIDIEGNDHLCLENLSPGQLPRYVSIETECLGDSQELELAASQRTLELLYEAGYRRFKLIAQHNFGAVTHQNLMYRNQGMVHAGLRDEHPARIDSDPEISPPFEARFTNLVPYQFVRGSSGPWGDDTPGPWLDHSEAKLAHQMARAAVLGRSGATSYSFWFDWHATS